MVPRNDVDRTGRRRGIRSADFSWCAEENACNMGPIHLSNEKWSAEFIDFVDKCVIRSVERRASVRELMEVRACERVES